MSWRCLAPAGYFLSKKAVVKLLEKLSKILWKIATFYLYQVFQFEFCKISINIRFSEYLHGFAFAWTYCRRKEKEGKKEVLEGSSFDNFFSIISLTSNSITTVIGKNWTLKSWSQSNLKLLFLANHCVKYVEMRAFTDSYFSVYNQNRVRIFPYKGRIVDVLSVDFEQVFVFQMLEVLDEIRNLSSW